MTSDDVTSKPKMLAKMKDLQLNHFRCPTFS